MKTRSTILLLAPLAACLAACGAHGGDASTDGTGQSTYGLSPDSTCDRYLECVTKTSSEDLPGALTSYGNESNCWTSSQQTADACATACASSMADLGSCGCATATECAEGTSVVGADFACLMTMSSPATCVTYTNLTSEDLALARMTCSDDGGTSTKACPTKNQFGTCTISGRGETSTLIFYDSPSLASLDLPGQCAMLQGQWTND